MLPQLCILILLTLHRWRLSAINHITLQILYDKFPLYKRSIHKIYCDVPLIVFITGINLGQSEDMSFFVVAAPGQ